MVRERIRVRFAKEDDAVFLSHLDTMRMFERAMRRADLPLSMTQGFNPHPRISFPLALAVGVKSTDEALEVDLDSWVPLEELKRRLERQLPRGFRVMGADLMTPGVKGRAREVTYEVSLPEGVEIGDDSVDSFLRRENILVERWRGDKFSVLDLKPDLLELRSEGPNLAIRLRVTEAGLVRPREILEALGYGEEIIARARVVRTRVIIE